MEGAERRYRVLVVEDDPDAFLIKAVFAHLDARAHITVTHTAEEAIESALDRMSMRSRTSLEVCMCMQPRPHQAIKAHIAGV